MRSLTRLASIVLTVAGIALYVGNTQAATSPAASEFYPLVGKWHGEGQLSQPGQKPIKLSISLHCRKASSGWAVRCAMVAKNKQMTMTESDLMGVDPVTGQAHWYAITNQGETHDHLVSWPGPHHMKAHYDWTQDGKHMHEDIQFEISNKHVHFASVVSANGKKADEFEGKLKR
ncbi:MAG: hypothetical protein P8Z75_01720 [Gammaproteobacteria bacterium]|jgi:hypothetical protein